MTKKILLLVAAIATTASVLLALQVGPHSSTTAKAAKLATRPADQLPKPPAPSTFPNVYRAQAEQAVFKVASYYERLGEPESGGTGFYLETPDGNKVILTNRHVCEGAVAANGYYSLRQGAKVYAAKRIAWSQLADVCALQAPREIVETRTPYVLSPTKPRQGDNLGVFGHPFLRPLTMSAGLFVNEIREPIGMLVPGFGYGDIVNIGRTDAMIFPGNSGSPIIDRTGQVVGIIFAMEGYGGHGLYVPAADIKQFLETLE
jgi:S1-C subfamily serine protease